YTVQTERGNGSIRSRAWKQLPDWIDCEVTLSPTAETRFGTRLVIIRQHIEDVDLAGKSRLCCFCDFSRALYLLLRGKERGAIQECPTVELHVCQLDSTRTERFSQIDHLR